MKNVNQLLLLVLFTCSISISAQRNKELEKKIIERKVDTTYTVEEAANMHFQFYRDTKKMKMTDSVEDLYTSILYNYVAKMARLDDKDKDFSKDERKVKFLKLVDEMNTNIKSILTDVQYTQHLKNFDRILKSVYRRSDWIWED